MPIYEYRCSDCQHELEILQKVSDAPLTTCPECASDGLVKKVSAAGFRLKGGGWYETDFKSKGQRNLAGDKAGSSGGGSSPAKPAADKPASSSGSAAS